MPEDVDRIQPRLESTLGANLTFFSDMLEQLLGALPDAPEQPAPHKAHIHRCSLKEAQRLEGLCGSCCTTDGILSQKIPPGKQLVLLGSFVCSKYPEVRRLALTSLSQMTTEHAVAKAFLALDDPDEDLQLMATKQLLNSHAKDKMRLLARQLSSPFQSVRDLAMQEVSRQSLRQFVQAYRGLGDDVRKKAASAVMKMKSEKLADEIKSELENASAEDRIQLLLAITAFSEKKQVGDVVAKLLDSSNKRVRATAVKALGACGGPDAASRIEPLLKDPDPRVRANAVEVVEELKGADAKALLLPLLSDENNRARGNAAKALWKLGEESAQRTVMEMLKSGDPLMRMSALWVLGEIRPTNVENIARPFAKRDPDPRVRKRAGIVLSQPQKRQEHNG